MKKYKIVSLIILVGSLIACSDNKQSQYQQPQVVQQTPTPDTSSAVIAAVGGAAIGALAANALNSRQSQGVNQQVAVQNAPQVTQPSQQRPWFKPNTLPEKQVVATTPTPVQQVAPPKPSYKPQSSYKQSAPSVSYSSSYKRK